MGENHFAAWPVALYGVILFFAACAYFILTVCLIDRHGKDSVLASAVGSEFKEKISLVFYAAAVALAFVHPMISCGLYILVAVMWLVPDRRIEKVLDSRSE
ncbi:MAG: hypothetical protein Q7T18_06090, partial [Sedimentisphaerales bacterium]|nr:hypothetical protein [Sedimentisphaerales bacterium]